jgi:OOP family OmpA-OmpF porin
MSSIKKLQKQNIIFLIIILFTTLCFSQRDIAKWKLQVAVGVNHGFPDGFTDQVYGKDMNFPTINIGLQHMFKPQFGAKLDIGYNRLKSGDGVPEFKTNYTRINAQLVYDPSNSIGFLPQRMRVVVHAGPGVSFTKPLGNLKENNLTFLNAMFGSEFHYALSETLSIFADGSYVFGFSGKDLTELKFGGLGAFNGNMIYATVGVSLSLSGCYYCD